MSCTWPLVPMLAATAGRLDSLRLEVRRHTGGCTGQVAWLLASRHAEVFTVAGIREALGLRGMPGSRKSPYSGRRVNSALQKLVAQGEVRVARLGNPKGYQWAG